MNNEPAGYFLYNEEYEEWEETHAGTPNSVPLYTHPVKEFFEDEPQAEELHEILQSNAELTDEEILYFYKPCFYHAEDFVFDIRAILRKASEK